VGSKGTDRCPLTVWADVHPLGLLN
jgi:hypothetical protein